MVEWRESLTVLLNWKAHVGIKTQVSPKVLHCCQYQDHARQFKNQKDGQQYEIILGQKDYSSPYMMCQGFCIACACMQATAGMLAPQ